MKICICSNVSDRTIQQLVNSQLSIKEVADQLKISKNCGKCWNQFQELFDKTKESMVTGILQDN